MVNLILSKSVLQDLSCTWSSWRCLTLSALVTNIAKQFWNEWDNCLSLASFANRCWNLYPGVSGLKSPLVLSPVLFCAEQHTVPNQYFFCSLRFSIHMLREVHVLYSSRHTLPKAQTHTGMHMRGPLLAPHLSGLIPHNGWGTFALQLQLLCAGTLLSLLILLLGLRSQVLPSAAFTVRAWFLPAPLLKNCISELISRRLNYA